MNGPRDKPAQNYANRTAPRLAIFLSAVVFPGAGQFAQKRWIAGGFYATIFSASAVALLVTIFVPLVWNLRALIELGGTDKLLVLRPAPYAKIFTWFGLLLVVYAAGLLDTVIYRRRQHTETKH